VAIAALVAAASLVSFAESYRGLYVWSYEHGLTGLWAAAWPLQVDVFIAVGELALFVALADRWAPRSRAAAWAVTLAGLAVSVASNVGHVAGHSLAARVTAAVPPLAAASALAVGLGVLKRVVEHHHLARFSGCRKSPQPSISPATTAGTSQAAKPISTHDHRLIPPPCGTSRTLAVPSTRHTTSRGDPLQPNAATGPRYVHALAPGPLSRRPTARRHRVVHGQVPGARA
jgi:hypothetical protein